MPRLRDLPTRICRRPGPVPGRVRTRFRATAVRPAVAALLCGTVLAGCAGPPERGPERDRSASSAPSPVPDPLWDRSPSSLAAVGDSITRGYDACGLLADCPEVSWATGSDPAVDSLAVRLLGAKGAAARSWNLARSGARMAELPAQMERAAARKPALVTVMAGANDACRSSTAAMTPVAEFRTGFAEALRRLRATAPTAQVYVASVPDLKRLWSEGRENPVGKQVWKLGLCASMLGDADDLGPAAERRRALVDARVRAYNAALREVCAADERCRYDDGAVFAYRFTGEQLSPWDWFHPGRDGQGRLAALAHRIVTDARPAPPGRR
ncbi:SGNH/GDSL hydrolase family protein [Streptomyces sp. LP05-1]|uniref:SGNH/GDSL hydrolase family protein n=1 Tax=Streptomyces pyxinae TaxID=2970734 RepID=A0ABT2CNF7_9ACTN|nr:SGNH/GDSL hydrolase family protein [Streptomyces sp. LP05-1]MCS0638236.1 SGNH/GDSL hydrolase family protein [Streptomyces sp. LP05-1]